MDPTTNLKNYIQDKTDYNFTEEDKNIIKHDLIDFIFRKINSNKYKASSTEKSYSDKIKDKIKLTIAHKLPLLFCLPFGATKNPYLDTAPGIDYAEVFNIAYVRDYLKPIAKAYKYGVTLQYLSVAVFEEKVNRIPVKDSDLYHKEFSNLIKFYQDLMPVNMNLSYKRVEDMISKDKINEQMDIKISELRKKWNLQPKEVIEDKLRRAKRNCLIKPEDKYTDNLILNAALGHDAFCSECWTTEAAPYDTKLMITLGHNYTNGWAVHIRSSQMSSVNFWSGKGVLVKKDDKIMTSVLSPLQYKDTESKITILKSGIFNSDYKNLGNLPLL